MYKSVVVEIPVAPPAVSEDSGSRKHPLRDDGGKCRFISDVFRTYRQDTRVCSALDSSDYPGATNHSSHVVFPLPELSLVQFDNCPWSAHPRRSLNICSYLFSYSSVETSYCSLRHTNRSCCPQSWDVFYKREEDENGVPVGYVAILQVTVCSD